ncbi:MAG TPA: polyprenyl synthetase family protein [Streptosporangiaceae bacterium]
MLATFAGPAGSVGPVGSAGPAGSVGPVGTAGSATGMGNLADRINAALEDFVAARLAGLGSAGGGTGRGAGRGSSSAATGLGSGGRNLRPAFCYWGWRVFEGDPGSKAIITVAAAIELLRRYSGTGRCLAWCAEMFYGCGLPDSRLAAGSLPLRLTHAEAKSGEYRRIGQSIGYPGAGYAVLRPMQIGAALAGADPDRVRGWEAFALPVGEALALREDVAGAFGGVTAAGRAPGDDLRDGKATALIAVARQQATPGQRAEIDELYGSAGLGGAGRDRLRSLIARSGALAIVEDRIVGLVDESLRALERLPAPDEIKDVLASRAFATFCGAAA